MKKKELALNDLQWLICLKPNQTKPKLTQIKFVTELSQLFQFYSLIHIYVCFLGFFFLFLVSSRYHIIISCTRRCGEGSGSTKEDFFQLNF